MTLTVPKSVEIRKNLVGWPKETCRVTSTSRSIIKGPTRRLCVWSTEPSVGAQRRASAAFIPMSAAPNAARITPPGGVAVIRHVIGQVAGLTAVRTSSPQVGTQSRSAESAQAARAAAVTSSGGSVIRAWLSRAATGGTSSSGISGTRVRVPHVSGCPIFSRSCQGHASWSGARAHRWRSVMSLTGRGTRQPVALAKPP